MIYTQFSNTIYHYLLNMQKPYILRDKLKIENTTQIKELIENKQ